MGWKTRKKKIILHALVDSFGVRYTAYYQYTIHNAVDRIDPCVESRELTKACLSLPTVCTRIAREAGGISSACRGTDHSTTVPHPVQLKIHDHTTVTLLMLKN